jgi:hypothetical protein
MVKYTCEICKKEFKQKGHYNDHKTKRKKPCIQKTIIITQESAKNPSNSAKNPPESVKSVDIVKSNNIKYKCNFCYKEFKRSDYLKKHLIDRCKTRKEESKEKELIFQDLLQKYEEIKILINDKDEKINNLTNEIKILKENKNIKIINKNNTNNGIITNNTINIIQHGKEDLSKLDKTIFYNAFLKYSGIRIPEKLIEEIHFNNKYPEFKNIYISDINRDKVMLYNGNEWILKRSDNIASDLLEKTTNYSLNKYEELSDEIKKLNDGIQMKIKKGLDIIEMINDFDEFDEVDIEGNPKKDIKRIRGLREKMDGNILLSLYNNRNKNKNK